METYYTILQISSCASKKKVKKAFRKLALIWHPDKNSNKKKAEEKFREIYEAYEVLSDDKRRQEYDLYIKNTKDGNNSCLPQETTFYDVGIIYASESEQVNAKLFFKCDPFKDFFNLSDDGTYFWMEGLYTLGPFKIRSKSIIQGDGTSSTYHNMTLVTVGEPHCMLRVFNHRDIISGDEIINRRVLVNGVETVIIFKNGFIESKNVNYTFNRSYKIREEKRALTQAVMSLTWDFKVAILLT